MANNESTSRASKFGQPVLPNMLLSTTYALNKSNSKRVAVGLDYHGGFYRPVVKFCSSGSPSKYITLDTSSWALIDDQMDAMAAYFQNTYSFYQEYGNPTKIFMPSHDLHFTTSFGAKAIAIDERPTITEPKLPRGWDQHEAQVPEDEAAATQTTDACSEPPCKKRKYENPPGIMMQSTTFDGLREVQACINERMKRLEECVPFVNNNLDCIIEFIKKKLGEEEDREKVKNILKDSSAFKQYYTLNHNDMVTYLKNKIVYVLLNDEEMINMILLEVHAYCLPTIAKDVYEFMF